MQDSWKYVNQNTHLLKIEQVKNYHFQSPKSLVILVAYPRLFDFAPYLTDYAQYLVDSRRFAALQLIVTDGSNTPEYHRGKPNVYNLYCQFCRLCKVDK